MAFNRESIKYLDSHRPTLVQGDLLLRRLVAVLLDSFGYHRVACARAGVLGRQDSPSRAWLHACVEKKRQGCNQRVVKRLGSDRASFQGRTPTLFGGVQLVVDATLVSPLHCDGTARPGSARVDGVALAVARRRKERTYPARLDVFVGEVGGRWSAETSTFVRLLVKAKTC